MSRANKIMALVLAFSVAFNVAFAGMWAYERFAIPQDEPFDEAGDAQRPLEWPATRVTWRQLDLAPEVRGRVREEMRRLREQVAGLYRQAEVERVRLLELLQSDYPDEAAIQEARQNLDRLQEEVRRLVLEHIRGMRNVVGPEHHGRMMQMIRRQCQQAGRRWRDRPHYEMPGRMQRGRPAGRAPGIGEEEVGR